ncbi:kinesin-like protein KIF13A isoform X2 [Ptychodera flava]|uniref:kinesin-like protein KIF13A isoform X2 n=1 Tax=Ptychodera flava TaxID=63121 RepID=UPI00396A9E38
MSSSKVRVAVRVRPFNRREIDLGTKCCIDMDGHQTILFPANCKGSDRKSPKTFAFDHCFWSVDKTKKKNYAGQEEVFKCIGTDILENAFQGYNACIFAYGQTGSGKSYTMMGTHENKGLIPRLCDSLFEGIANNDDPTLSFKVEVSYMEIYNEKVRDLLDPKGGKTNLKVREHKIYGPYVDGLSTLAVSSFEDIESLMLEGNKSRTVAATNMNAESSRSHAVFNVTLTQTLTDFETDVSGEKVSKLSLVDLAGSERAQKSGATGERLKEGSNINKSLTTLGLVISALADQSVSKHKQKFVPYRDSVLTWLLKECLGGNSKTVMCATISPAADNFDETLSTLRYADRAKRIVNHAVINEDPNARIIRELRDEVDSLKKQLKVAESMKADTLKEQLVESEKLMKEMTVTWEEKLQNTERIIQENQQALEKMGISVQTSGIKVEKDKCFLVNLNADPALNELLVYYLKDHTLVGRPDAPSNPDIQLSGLGIMPEHCVIDIDNEYEVYLTPMANARTCVNGSHIETKTALRHGDRILWGNNHFFRINCPRPPGAGSSGANTPESEVPADFDFAQSEVVMKELSNDPIQNAMKNLENQHREDKDKALERQKNMYERQLEMLRNKLTPNQRQQLDRFDIAQLSPQSGNSNAINMQTRYQQWEEERDDVFRQSLSKLREEVVKANALVREANFLAEEMGKQTEFHVTLQIPASNLTPNRKRGAIVSEPAIQVKRKGKGTQIWAMEKLENKIIDMRDMYEDRKERGLPLKDTGVPISGDPFYETQENHNLIGVANIFLEVLFHDVKLSYAVPIINQQGEVSGRLHIELQRISGPLLDRSPDSDTSTDSGGYEVLGDVEPEGLSLGSQLTCRLRISQASGLPPSLANFVFCQYTFWGEEDSSVVPPIVKQVTTRRKIPEYSMKFDHVKEYTVNVTEEFIEHALDGSLAIEVWGHRSAGFDTKPTGWEVDSLHAKSRSLADRWGELTRKIELWLEVLELNEQGEYFPVECQTRPEVLTGGVFQLRQGHSRRICVKIKPVHDSGTLPLVCEAITGISVGSICARSRLQKGLDSYQDEDLTRLREKWSEALMRRREYLDEQIHKIINKSEKNDHDVEREASLINQWVSLTEERNAVLVPAPHSGIPGAPADWNPPSGMETHIPVLFLDLNTDEMGSTCLLEGSQAAGINSILPKEHGTKFYNLPIVKYCDKDVSAVASWDSSIHDSIHLNRVTGHNERVYLIVKVVARLSHPAAMEMVLRKRISVNIYKKQSFGSALRKKLARADPVYACGVTYEVVSNIPKASEDPEDRESLALMAASGADEGGTADGETYIEKYTKGVSAVESILALDRLRQEVVIKEKLTAQGRPLRKTASVPNIQGALSRSIDSRFDGLDEDFRMSKSESLHSYLNTSQQSLPAMPLPGSPYGNPGSPYGNPASPYGYYSHSPHQTTEPFSLFRGRTKSDAMEAPYMYSSLGSLHSSGGLNSPNSPVMPPFGMFASSPKTISASPAKYSHHHLGSVKEEKSKELSHTDGSNLIEKSEEAEDEAMLSPNAIMIPGKSPSHNRCQDLQQTITKSSEPSPTDEPLSSSFQRNFPMSLENVSNRGFSPLNSLLQSHSPEHSPTKTVISNINPGVVLFTSSNFSDNKQRPLSTTSSGYSSNLTLAEDSLSIRSVDEGPDFNQHSNAEQKSHDNNGNIHELFFDEIVESSRENSPRDEDETKKTDTLTQQHFEDGLNRENMTSEKTAECPERSGNNDKIGDSLKVSEDDEITPRNESESGELKAENHGDEITPRNERFEQTVNKTDEIHLCIENFDKKTADNIPSQLQGKELPLQSTDSQIPSDVPCSQVVKSVIEDEAIDESKTIGMETDVEKHAGDGEENECGGDGEDEEETLINLSGFEPLVIIEESDHIQVQDKESKITDDIKSKIQSSVGAENEQSEIPEMKIVSLTESDMDVGGDERLSIPDSEKSDHHSNSGVQDELSDGDDSLSVCSFDSRHESDKINVPIPKWLKVGERVAIGTSRTGTVKFIGNTAFKSGTWVGVKLDLPTGKNNGSVDGVYYFRCPPKHGIFIRADKLIQSNKPPPSKAKSIPSKITTSASPQSSKGSSPVGSPSTGKQSAISKTASPLSSKGNSPMGSPKVTKSGKQ